DQTDKKSLTTPFTNIFANSQQSYSQQSDKAHTPFSIQSSHRFVECENQGILDSDFGLALELLDDPPEVKSLQSDEVLLQKTLIEILNKFKSKDLLLRKTFMNSNFLNNIIDLTDNKMEHEIQFTLNLDQKLYLDEVLKKQAWIPTPEFKNYCDQFTDDVCNRVKILTLVQKSFTGEYFDLFLHEGYDITHDIMKHL
ncbi:18161_t:CDS:2, partial [Funneliformis geosporum]